MLSRLLLHGRHAITPDFARFSLHAASFISPPAARRRRRAAAPDKPPLPAPAPRFITCSPPALRDEMAAMMIYRVAADWIRGYRHYASVRVSASAFAYALLPRHWLYR